MIRKLKNGFTALENLKICIAEGTAVATTFERAIEQEGLTMEVIKLLSEYYADDIKEIVIEKIGDSEGEK